MGVEHVLAGVREAQLEDAALALALDHGVGEVAGLEPRAGRVVVEEVRVDVERVEEVVLENVHEVDPHELAALHLHRALHVLEGDGVDRVDVVRAVEVGVEPVHDHHELVGRRAALLGIDDDGAVEPLGDVLGERRRVAVVEVEAERRCVELIDGPMARADVAVADARHAVHDVAVDAVEVHRVRVGGAVHELDAQPLPLARPERRAGDAVVVGPGDVLHAWRDLDLLLARDDLPLAHSADDRALVEIAQDLLRIEAVDARVDRPLRTQVAGGGGVALAVPEVLGRRGARLMQPLVRDELVEDGQCRAGGGRAAQQLASREFGRSRFHSLARLRKGFRRA